MAAGRVECCSSGPFFVLSSGSFADPFMGLWGHVHIW